MLQNLIRMKVNIMILRFGFRETNQSCTFIGKIVGLKKKKKYVESFGKQESFS